MPFKFDESLASVKAVANRVTNMGNESRRAIRAVVLRSWREKIDVRTMARLLRKDLPGLSVPGVQSVLNYRRGLLLSFPMSAAKLDNLVAKYSQRKIRERAQVIARTESMKILNDGQSLAFKQAQKKGLLGKKAMKVWITSPDENLCEICAPLEGFMIPINEDKFPIPGPPGHPQCRCTIGVIEDKKKVKAVTLDDVMRNGEVISKEQMFGSINNPFRVKLRFRGKTAEAVWKPTKNDYKKWAKSSLGDRELLAFQIDQELGVGLVPRTVKRTIDGEIGSLQFWMDGKAVLKFGTPVGGNLEYTLVGKKVLVSRQDMIDITMMDIIMGNTDRHVGNALINIDGRLIMIDNGSTFWPGSGLRLDVQTEFWNWAKLTDVEQKVWAARLKNPNLKKLINGSPIDKRAKDLAAERIKALQELIDSNDVQNYQFLHE